MHYGRDYMFLESNVPVTGLLGFRRELEVEGLRLLVYMADNPLRSHLGNRTGR